MSILSSLFGSKKKPNLQPDTPRLQQSQLYFTGGNPGTDLRQLMSNRLFNGQGLGFGDDFVSRSTNPAIQASETQFREKTLPQINSQLSARGLARSAGPNLATDVLGKAQRDQSNYVDQMVADFYRLNEAQKKTDFSEALGAAQNLGNQEERMSESRAAASERLAGNTAAQQNMFRDQDRQLAMSGIQAAGGFLSGGGLGNIAGLVGKIPGIGGQLSGMLSAADKVATTNPKVGTLTLDNIDDQKIAQQYLRSRGWNI